MAGKRVWVGLLLAVLGVGTAVAQAGAGGLAFKRAEHLKRGINTGMWFAQAPGKYTDERLRTFTTDDDLRLIRDLGFDHIRLSIDPDPLVLWQQGDAAGLLFVQRLDHVVHTATGLGLAVIVDVHPEPQYKKDLLQGAASADGFAALWKALAGHYASTDPKLVFFELMNEPEQVDAARWRSVETQAAQAVRSAAPGFTIIAGGLHWTGLKDLLAMTPIDVPNVIYTFHDYDPMVFTHQGATWAGDNLKPLRGVPFPPTPAGVAMNVAQETTPAGKGFVEQYGASGWDSAKMNEEVAQAERWSHEHGVPVYVGEFGVYRRYAPAADRARWIAGMRATMERHGLGWAMWDYQTDFGLVVKKDGKTTVDPAVGSALGLSPAVIASRQ